jgi:hypothetical protein
MIYEPGKPLDDAQPATGGFSIATDSQPIGISITDEILPIDITLSGSSKQERKSLSIVSFLSLAIKERPAKLSSGEHRSH